jgi:hypothetical protein
MITYVREKRILFMSAQSDKQSVEILRKMYQEQGGPNAINDVRDFIDNHSSIKTILEDGGLGWPDNDAEITGSSGFFDSMEEDTAK